MSDDDALFEQVGDILRTRPDWHFEPATTPGSQPSWCLDPGGEVTLAVNVVGGAISVYLPERDREISLDSVEALVTWIDQNEKRFTRT
jgi:hypothetical protein